MKYTKIILALTFLMGANLYSRDEAAQGCNRFAINTYKQLSKQANKEDPEKNIFFSPLSIVSGLVRLNEGARGKTAEEISKVLGIGSIEDYRSQFAEMEKTISKKNPDYTLETANQIFVAEGISIAESFKKRVQSYGALVFESIDFSKAKKASKRINAWVSEKTHGKITELVKPSMFDSLTCLAVINAIYFKGNWRKAFAQENTCKRPFNTATGNAVTVDMMQQENTFNYTENNEFTMLELPYKGNEISLFVMLPRERVALSSIEESLDEHTLENAAAQLHRERVDVKFPKLKMEEKYNLIEVLSCLGIHQAFDVTKADFSGITDGKTEMYISDVVHKACITIDEQGSEAAAATAIVCTERCAQPQGDVKEFNANKPFILFMRNNLAKTIIFMGKFNNSNA